MFPPAEDTAVMDWREKNKKDSSYAKRMWVDAEKPKITSHSWQAMRARYCKLRYPSTTTTALITAAAVSFFFYGVMPIRDKSTQTPHSHNLTPNPTPATDSATFSTSPIIIEAWCSKRRG